VAATVQGTTSLSEAVQQQASAAPREIAEVRPAGALAAAWGIAGVLLLLLRAVVGLSPNVLQAAGDASLGALHWSLAAVWLVFMGYSEGYRGFQRGFAPRVVARAVHLARAPRPLHALLAPFFCMGLFHASRRRLLTSWTLVFMIVGLVTVVRLVPQPWRGLIDAGVILGLGWGILAVLVFVAQALRGHPPAVPADLPAARG
jgi:hypothetical protein